VINDSVDHGINPATGLLVALGLSAPFWIVLAVFWRFAQ
jgi:hypothetical protein